MTAGFSDRCGAALDAARCVRLMPRMPAILADALIDKVLAGERLTPEDARALYRLPLVDLGELANRRRNLAKRAAYGGRGEEIVTYIIDRDRKSVV